MSVNQWSAFGSLCMLCFGISAMWQMAENEIREWRAHDPGDTGASDAGDWNPDSPK